DLLPHLNEWADPGLIQTRGWPDWRTALVALHHPEADADLLPETPARQRLAYDELLAHQIALQSHRRTRQSQPSTAYGPGPLSAAFKQALPWSLTNAQARTLAEIRADMSSGLRMNRLVQGDVGSGKTVVAALAMLDVAGAGAQAVLMAPTEILARQHYERLSAQLEPLGVACALLTGRDKGKGRAQKLEAIADGTTRLVFGTHAVFQDDVIYHRLGLAVIDEQHRFGVRERQRLCDKGESVHVLSLSATPIPRSLALTQYGDLHLSSLDEKPPGRQPVTTAVLPLDRIGAVVARLKQAIAKGTQAYWICPLVNETEELDLAAAEARVHDLSGALGLPVGLVHGQRPPAEKEATMQAFSRGEIAVLCATTVVEVGVDVPNATIMVIEHAERFGLAQLHQLRGRVGRGGGESACILLYGTPLSKAGRARLEVLRDTEDGFVIAERDWQLRGEGDLLGLKQSGFPAYQFADPLAHGDLLSIAARDAGLILRKPPAPDSPRAKALNQLVHLFDWPVAE
ncbi:MAG: ATP-dependent DNA helicase RecG, partial [Asticcacaulis sp.]